MINPKYIGISGISVAVLLWVAPVQSQLQSQQPADLEPIFGAVMDYWEERGRAVYSLPDGPFAIDLRPARVTTPSGPILNPAAARRAAPELLRRVAIERGSPIGTAVQMTDCQRGEGGRVFCEVAGAAAIVGFGQVLIEDRTAQVELRTWYRKEGPSFMPEGSWNLNMSQAVLTLEEQDGNWKVVEVRPG